MPQPLLSWRVGGGIHEQVWFCVAEYGDPGTTVTFTGSSFTGVRNCRFIGKSITYQQPATVTSDTSATCTMTDSTPGEVLSVGLDGAVGVGIGEASQTLTTQ
jgi:hypothetical protein